jgi:hypothetical protein
MTRIEKVKRPVHHINITMTEEALKILRNLADQRDTSVSGIIRDIAIEEWARIGQR